VNDITSGNGTINFTLGGQSINLYQIIMVSGGSSGQAGGISKFQDSFDTAASGGNGGNGGEVVTLFSTPANGSYKNSYNSSVISFFFFCLNLNLKNLEISLSFAMLYLLSLNNL
jgi:hypothetical protein